MSNFGSRIKKIRSTLSLSQEEFGVNIGLTKSGVSNVEKNKSFMSPEVLCRLIVNYNVNLNYLFNGVGLMFLNNCENTHVFIKNEKPVFNFKNWGKRLAEILAENEETPYAFSKRTGIKESRIDKFILDSVEPTISELNAIKSNVDVSIDELLYGETIENKTQADNDISLSPEEIWVLKKLASRER